MIGAEKDLKILSDNAEPCGKQKQNSALSYLSGFNLQEDLAGTSQSQGNKLPQEGHLTVR